MQPQYVAMRSAPKGCFEALESQTRRIERDGCILDKDSTMLQTRISQETLTLSTVATTHSVSKHPFSSNRRLRCQRASNYWQHLALSSLLLPVRASSRSKNLSWSSQSRLSQSKPANTSNTFTEWASAPTLTKPHADANPQDYNRVAGGAVS